VSFAFNDVGGGIVRETHRRSPANDSTGLSYKLGIIIDGELFSAPAIRSKITDKGEITGSFTEVEGPTWRPC